MSELFSLKGRVIVITGAAGLLGQKHAEAIASFGGIPILIDLHQTKVVEIASNIELDYSVKAQGFHVDITNEEEVSKNVKLIVNNFYKI